MTIEDDGLSPEAMLAFYRRLYPYKPIFQWLNHGPVPTKLFTHREFAFTLPGDIYIRYNSFSTLDEFRHQVCNLNPARFEIGPMYSARPKDKKMVRPGAFKPLQRELVFDIDMTDYDPVIDAAIRDQFGYSHLLWVYSGRRGIHLWVSDKEAMELTDDERKAVVNYLTVVTGGKEMRKKVNVRQGSKPLPPSINAALKPLSKLFPDLILADQNSFASQEGSEELLRLIPDKKVVNGLTEAWKNDPNRSSDEKWSDLKAMVKRCSQKDTPERANMIAAMEDIILQYTYPRLDAEVSKHRNHLLKAPFCIHPKTGRVCVPVDPNKIDEFDPEKVPTVGQLLRELDTAVSSEGEHHSDWEKTSLKPYVELLERHAMGLMDEVRRIKREGGMDLSW